MRTLQQLWLRFRSLFRRAQVERELSAEFAFHLEQQIQENLASGMSAAEARSAALRTIGGISQLQEECRDMRRVNYIEELFGDVQYAVRGFREKPSFAVLAILTLALGIGSTTALFSLVNTVLLRPLPVAAPERVAALWENFAAGGFPHNTPSPANFLDWAAQNQTFEDLTASAWQTFNLTGAGDPERLNGLRVRANFLTLLGVKPVAGQLFVPDDDRAARGRVAVIGHGLWQRHFGSDSNVVGRAINLNGQSHTVIGVAPDGFEFPAKGAQVWVAPGFAERDLAQRGAHYLSVFGRLKPGVSLDQARADMNTVARRLEEQYPQTNKNVGITIASLREYYAGDLSMALGVLLAAVGALLLIACANLAHLFLARGAIRRREIAMRAALGAGRGRVIRQLLTESTVLAVAAAALGAALSTGAYRFLARLIPENFPEGSALGFDLPVLAFTIGIAFLTSMLFGAGPALQASRLALNEVLKGTATGSARASMGRFRGILVAAEMALTVILLVAAGLLLASYSHIRNVNTGFRAENVLTLETALAPSKYLEPSRRAEFYRQVLDQVTQIPGVISAGYVNFPPLTMKGGTNGFAIEGRPRPQPGQEPDATNRTSTADYLRTIGVPLLRGRMYDEHDGPDAPRVMVINEAMARTYWPGEDALGAQVRFGDGGPTQPLYTIVGIAADVKQIGLDAPTRPEMYLPVTQPAPGGSFFWPRTLVVRTAGDPMPLTASLRRAVAAVDSDQPVASVRTMNEILDTEVSGRQTQTTILTAFAIAALLLASVGLYGVLSYAVTQRTSEIGLRMALGAQRGAVIRGILAQALKWTVVGAAAGLAAALALTQVFSKLLFEVSPSDPATFAGVTILLFAVAIVASFIPARRAASVDPVIALRHE